MTAKTRTKAPPPPRRGQPYPERWLKLSDAERLALAGGEEAKARLDGWAADPGSVTAAEKQALERMLRRTVENYRSAQDRAEAYRVERDQLMVELAVAGELHGNIAAAAGVSTMIVQRATGVSPRRGR